MKICHIISSLGDGGAEATLYRLCLNESISSSKILVISLTSSGKYVELLRDIGVSVVCLDFKSVSSFFSNIRTLYRVLKTSAPEVVQTWMYHADFFGGIAARLAGIKNISWGIHNTQLTLKKSRVSTILISKLCALLSYFVPKNIICCAEESLRVHAKQGYKRSLMSVINNGYDLTKFYNDPEQGARIRNELNIESENFVIGLVGRFDPNKDHENFFAAAGQVVGQFSQVRFVLAGSGIDYDNSAIVSMIDKHGLTSYVSLLGSRTDIKNIYNALDLFVLSSSSEAFPNVLCEAMACGKVCVSTDVGDAKLIVGDSGWIVPPSDATSLSRAICNAISLYNSGNLSDYSVNCRNRIQDNYLIETMVKRYHRVWDVSE